MTVHFFCTRCRRLLKYPRSRSGSVIYCPYCQQAIIVPTLLNDDESTDVSNSRRDGATQEILQEPPLLDSNISDDNPENRFYRIETVPHLTGTRGETTVPYDSNEAEIASLELKRTPLSDREFWNVVQPSPSEPIVKPPVFSPDVDWKTDEQKRRLRGKWSFVLATAVVIVAILGIGKLGGVAWNKYRPKPTTNDSVHSDEILIDGRLTFSGDSGRLEGDEGGVVFVLPIDFPKDGRQLILSKLSSRLPESTLPQETVERLKEVGGAFARADADGYFDLTIPRSGRYKILMVSARVAAASASNPEQMDEINEYFYRPDRVLLNNCRYIWDERLLDENENWLEYRFGK